MSPRESNYHPPFDRIGCATHAKQKVLEESPEDQRRTAQAFLRGKGTALHRDAGRLLACALVSVRAVKACSRFPGRQGKHRGWHIIEESATKNGSRAQRHGQLNEEDESEKSCAASCAQKHLQEQSDPAVGVAQKALRKAHAAEQDGQNRHLDLGCLKSRAHQ